MAWVVWIRDTHAVSINVANNGGKVGKFSSSIFWSIFSFGTFSSSVVCTHHEWRLKSQGAGLTSPANEDLSTRQYLVQLFRSLATTSYVLPQLNHSFYCHWLLFCNFSSSFNSILPHSRREYARWRCPNEMKKEKKSHSWCNLVATVLFRGLWNNRKWLEGHFRTFGLHGNECVLNNEPRIQWLFISHNGNTLYKNNQN